MGELIYYADEKSIDILNDGRPVVILVGSDFGYANFGDILQLKSALGFYRKQSGMVPVPVYSLDAITDKEFVARVKDAIGVSVLLFVSGRRVDVSHLGLNRVGEIPVVAGVHLYGGGFLNDKWGDYVLDVVESFFQEGHRIPYVISGQQVGEEIKERLVSHVRRFKPDLFGVRDYESLERLDRWGVKAEFSFDDACEPLLDLSRQIPDSGRRYTLGHLNLSPYAADSWEKKSKMLVDAFQQLKSRYPEHEHVVVSAYNDRRSIVSDSLTSIASLETDFPYKAYCVVDLADAAYSGEISLPALLSADLALSCSYHVALFLHLSGIPCWLFAQNTYYEQKALALNCASDYRSFLDDPSVPDYSERLLLRKAWLQTLGSLVGAWEQKTYKVTFPVDGADDECDGSFNFKPHGLDGMERIVRSQADQIDELRKYSTDLDRAFQNCLGHQKELEASGKDQFDQLVELRSYVESLESMNFRLGNQLEDAKLILGSRLALLKRIFRGRM